MKTFVVGPTCELTRLRHGSERRFYRNIEIDPAFRDLAHGEALARVVKGLNRHLNACGCGLASVCALVAIVGVAVLLGTTWKDMSLPAWKTWAIGFGAVCGAAASGKSAGLAHSEWMFRRLLDRLAVLVKPTNTS